MTSQQHTETERIRAIAASPGMTGRRLEIALELANRAPDMSAADIVEWTLEAVPADRAVALN